MWGRSCSTRISYISKRGSTERPYISGSATFCSIFFEEYDTKNKNLESYTNYTLV